MRKRPRASIRPAEQGEGREKRGRAVNLKPPDLLEKGTLHIVGQFFLPPNGGMHFFEKTCRIILCGGVFPVEKRRKRGYIIVYPLT